jgi:hypothetical protein
MLLVRCSRVGHRAVDNRRWLTYSTRALRVMADARSSPASLCQSSAQSLGRWHVRRVALLYTR